MPPRRTRRGRSLDPGEPAASGVGSSATSQQASTSGRSAPKKRSGGIAQPSITAGPAGPGSRNRLDGRPDCPLRIQRVAAQRLCGVLDVVLAVVDFGRRVDFRVRRHRGRARRRRDRRYRRCRIRVAPPISLRPNPYRSAARHRAARRAARRHGGPAEPPVAAPGNGSGPLSALSAERTHTFGTGLVTVQSRLRRGYLETSPR